MAMFTDDWNPDRMMNGSSGGMMYGGGLMVVLMLLVAALFVVALFWVLRTHGAAPRAVSGPEPGIGSPRDLLDQRLARGDISPEDYRSTRQLLEH